MEQENTSGAQGQTPTPVGSNMPSEPMMDMEPKKSNKGLIIGIAIAVVVVGAGIFLSTQTELLRGTLEVGDQDAARAEYLQQLQAAKTAADEQKAEAEYVKKVVDILEK